MVSPGKAKPLEGRIAGQQANTPARIDVKIIISDMDNFLPVPNHLAKLEGTFTLPLLGGHFPSRTGISIFLNRPDQRYQANGLFIRLHYRRG